MDIATVISLHFLRRKTKLYTELDVKGHGSEMGRWRIAAVISVSDQSNV